MIRAESFLQEAKGLGFRLFTGVPCSYLKAFINYVIDAPDLDYIGAANEGDAVAIASGAELAGSRSVVMFQNSGFGNAVSPLTSLNSIFRIPVLILATWRGEPGGSPDEPQHELMGQVTPELFELMRIPWEPFPRSEDAIAPALGRAVRHMSETRLPYALIMKKDSVSPNPLKTRLERRRLPSGDLGSPAWTGQAPSRTDVLKAVQDHVSPTDAVIATTGYTGRALYAIEDRPSQLYMVGSMGCASSLGLGLARCQPGRRVIVLDGDGAALMRLGALATIGYERPANLLHVVLDNEAHDSTGGQSTVSHSIDLARIAHACGYLRVVRATTAGEVGAVVQHATPGLTFVHVKTRPGEAEGLPRPTMTPPEVAERFRAWLHRSAPLEATA
jgi:phosphonopyruvate decarboxylase